MFFLFYGINMAIARENFKIVHKNIKMRYFHLQGTHVHTNLASNLSTVSIMTVDRLCNQSSMMDLVLSMQWISLWVHLCTLVGLMT